MKKITLFFLMLIMSAASFGQETNTPLVLTKADYLKKSKSQKIAAFLLLGVGVGTIAIAAPGNVSLSTTSTLAIVGGAATVSSILLFVASGKNKRRAMNMTASFDIKNMPDISSSGFSYKKYPAISLKLNL